MRLLITGERGFVGGAVYNHYLRKGGLECLESSSTAGDLDNVDNVKELMKYAKPTHIVHLAGRSSTKGDLLTFLEDNIAATWNLVECAPTGCRFIFSSSSLVYHDSLRYAYEYDMVKPNTLYGTSKVCCENVIDIATAAGKIRGVNLRLCAVVGKETTHGMFHEVVKTLLKTKNPVELWGRDPGSLQSYIYISDVISAIDFFLNNNYTGSFNIAGFSEISKKNLADCVMDKLNIEREIIWKDDGKENYWVSLNINKAYAAGWKPAYSSLGAVIKAAEDIKKVTD